MAIATYSAYVTRRDAPYQQLPTVKNATTVQANKLYSLWQINLTAGSTPSTAAVPSSTITGAIGQFDSSGTQRLLRMSSGQLTGLSSGPSIAGTIFLFDRLSHQGGLSGTSTSAQTTNLPTAALTRHTNGIGVQAAVEVYSQIGGTATTYTANYDSDSALGHTTQATGIGNTGFREGGRLMPFLLADGDKGVKAVNSITLAGTTGTIGNFGITLYWPILILPIQAVLAHGISDLEALFDFPGFPTIDAGACLFWGAISPTSIFGPTIQTIMLGED